MGCGHGEPSFERGTSARARRQITQFGAALLITALLAGSVLRVVGLGAHVVWDDEATTWLRLAGTTWYALGERVRQDPPLTAGELHTLTQPAVGAPGTAILRSLRDEDPHHPPLYYLLLRGWVAVFGHSAVAVRGFSAAVGIVTIPLIALLACEIFGTTQTASVAALLFAVSPLEVHYAQEAREYALWVFAIALSSFTLARAIRRGYVVDWVFYCLATSLSLYTHLLSFILLPWQGLAVVLLTNRRRALGVWVAAAGAFLFAAPWVIVAVGRVAIIHGAMSWTETPISFPSWLWAWGRNTSLLFLDLQRFYLDDAFVSFSVAHPSLLVATPIAVGLVLLAGHVAARSTLAVAALLLPAAGFALTISLPDLVAGGRRALIARYEMPVWTSCLIAVAYLLTYPPARTRRTGQRTAQHLTLCVLFAAGIASNLAAMRAPSWWTNYHAYVYPEMAAVIRRESPAIVLAPPSALGSLLTLGRTLPETTVLRLTDDFEATGPDARSGSIFLLNPSNALLARLRPKAKVEEVVHGVQSLWQVTPGADWRGSGPGVCPPAVADRVSCDGT